MRFGVELPSDGIEPRDVAALGAAAEAAGWDGVFVWDCLDGNEPWVTLAAVAMQTTRMRLGTMVTPPSRRRPWKLAQETATLDRLSGGRLILPVGLGALNTGFARVHEVLDRQIRAAMLDESLDILVGLWSGRPFQYHGAHYRVEEWAFYPVPVQQPRIPIWVVGAWPRPRSLARAIRWDGIIPTKVPPGAAPVDMTPDDIRALRDWIAQQRPATAPFDIVLEGETPGDPAAAAAVVRPYAEAGATWWLENVWAAPRAQGGLEGMRRRIAQGPPLIS